MSQIKTNHSKESIYSKLNRISKRWYPIIAFVLTALVYYMFLSYSQMLSTGKYELLHGDLLDNYVPTIRALARDIRNGTSCWFSWSNYLGAGTAMTNAFNWNPINILYVIFYDADPVIITTIVLMIKTALSGMSFQLFASRTLKCKGYESIIFAIFYAMCSYQVIYLVNTIFMDALYMCPIIIMLLFELYDTGKYRLLVLAYAYLFIVQFYIGYMIGIFTVVCLIAYSFYRADRIKWKLLWRRWLLFFGVVVLAAGLAAVILLPAGITLFTNQPEDATKFPKMIVTIIDVYNNLFIGQYQTMSGYYPYIYCGIPALLLLPYYFFNKSITVKEKICTAGVGAFLLICTLTEIPYKFIHAFDAPDMFGFRFSFLISFWLLFVSCRQYKHMRSLSMTRFLLLCIGNVIIYGIAGYYQMKTIANESSNCLIYVLINLIFMLAWGLLDYFYLTHKYNQVNIVFLALLITMVETCLNACLVYGYTDEPISYKETTFYSWYDGAEEAVEKLTENTDCNNYRVRYENDLINNSGAFWGYNGLDSFSTAENTALRNVMRNLGIYTSPRLLYDYGYTDVTDMIFGVKYTIEGIDPYMIYSEVPQTNYVVNESVLGIGYLVDEKLIDLSLTEHNAFENQNHLLSAMTGDEIVCFIRAQEPEIIENGIHMTIDEDGINYVNADINKDMQQAEIMYTIPKNYDGAYLQIIRNTQGNDSNAPKIIGEAEIKYLKEVNHIACEHIEKLCENNDICSFNIVMDTDDYQSYKIDDLLLYYYDESMLHKAYLNLKNGQMNIVEFTDGYVKASVDVKGEKKLLFTTIPAVDGWEVKVNQKDGTIIKVLNGAFIAVMLEEGNNELEFIYTPPGFVLGKYISGIAILFYLLLFINSKRRKRIVRSDNCS